MDLFDQLFEFSKRYFKDLKIEEEVTPWGPEDYDGGRPKGAILHYTADADFDRVVKFFMREKYNARAAANVVIADRRFPRCEKLLEDLPLVAALPVTIIQCALPGDPTWHATWASPHTYGIELVNVGEVRPASTGSGYVSHWKRNHDPSEPEWTMPWEHPTKTATKGWSRHWEPYTSDQVKALVTLLRALRVEYPDLKPSWVVGHECVQGVDTNGAKKRDKRDPGPMLPVHSIRAAMFGDTDDDWMDIEPAARASKQRDEMVREYAASLLPVQRDKKTNAIIPPELPEAGASWARFHSAVQAMARHGGKFDRTAKTAMKLLGYHVPVHIHDDVHDTDRDAMWMFQKMSGLRADRVPGPRTRQALAERLYDRGILKR